jgi:maltokinase
MTIEHGELTGILPEWLPRQRWFGGKGRAVATYEVRSDVPLAEGDPELRDVIVRVAYTDATEEHYQLLLGVRTDPGERLEHAVMGHVGGRAVYDATYDTELTGLLLRLIAEGGKTESLVFGNAGEKLDVSLHSRVLGGEQSNTSLVYGDDYIVKLFRRLAPGVNADLEMTRALDEVGSTHVARPLGWFEGSLDGEPVTLGMLQEYLRFGTDGWALALTSVRDLYAEGDLHADEVGGDFAGEADRLGAATAEVHADLATAFGTESVGPARLAAVAAEMKERLAAAREVASELEVYVGALLEVYDALATRTEPMTVQRVHGDYHLGQVLRTESGWVLLDFEGEPARPFDQRRRMMSPLRDVAGMLRSFDYAARHLLTEQPGQAHLEYRANEWAQRNRTAFCDGYARASGCDPREDSTLLRAFELDKAVYEVVYEARNRPTWLPIPLGSIARLAGDSR